jgi:hypothetical protein
MIFGSTNRFVLVCYGAIIIYGLKLNGFFVNKFISGSQSGILFTELKELLFI